MGINIFVKAVSMFCRSTKVKADRDCRILAERVTAKDHLRIAISISISLVPTELSTSYFPNTSLQLLYLNPWNRRVAIIALLLIPGSPSNCFAKCQGEAMIVSPTRNVSPNIVSRTMIYSGTYAPSHLLLANIELDASSSYTLRVACVPS